MFDAMKGMLFKETLWVNLLRCVAAGMVWMVILLFSRPPEFSLTQILLAPLWFPLGYLMVVPLVYGCLNLISSISGLPIITLGNYILALIVIPGDPIVYVLHKVKPDWVPVERYSFIDFALFIFVTKNTAISLKPIQVEAKQVSVDPACPFAGRVLADKDTKVFGFNWPAKETIFHIAEDWKVSTMKDLDFGWIDVNGAIHKGRPFGKIDPKAVLYSDAVAKISGPCLYVGSEKVGQLVKW
jgi:hypothetical protein